MNLCPKLILCGLFAAFGILGGGDTLSKWIAIFALASFEGSSEALQGYTLSIKFFLVGKRSVLNEWTPDLQFSKEFSILFIILNEI